jgi:hypothetical protein
MFKQLRPANDRGGETSNLLPRSQLDIRVGRGESVRNTSRVEDEEGRIDHFLLEDLAKCDGGEVKEVNLRSERGQRTTKEEWERTVRTILIPLNELRWSLEVVSTQTSESDEEGDRRVEERVEGRGWQTCAVQWSVVLL